MADDDYNDVEMGYDDEPPEPEIEEGAEEDVENNNEEAPDAFVGTEAEEKEDAEPVQRPWKTSKYMTNMNAPVMVELEGETDPLEVSWL